MNNTDKVRIHGREYRTVALRVSEFRAEYPAKDGWAIVTQIIERNDDTVVMRAAIVKDCVEVATGFAEEQRKASQINQTSALENCETSAIGRCLAAFGLGGSEYASANEVANAIHQQGQSRGHQVRRSFPKPKTNEQQMTEEQVTYVTDTLAYIAAADETDLKNLEPKLQQQPEIVKSQLRKVFKERRTVLKESKDGKSSTRPKQAGTAGKVSSENESFGQEKPA